MLTTLILKTFVPGFGKSLTPAERVRCGIVSGITGIVCNVLLAVLKVILAILSGSIAVAADAVNNLSDAGSGVIAVAGFRLSSQPPDAEHPFGHGRTEYVAALIVAVLIVALGVSFLKDSVMALFREPGEAAGNGVIVFFGATILVKCWLFFFYRKVGKLIHSEVIRAAAYDSLSDCMSTGVVVVSLIAARFTDFPVDGAAGILVAGMILWAGSQVLREAVSKLLGEPPDKELVEKVREVILASPGIDGVHDIMIHNYGENSYYVTAHAEISCDGDRFSAHDILENAEIAAAQALPVHLLLHADPYHQDDPEVIFWRSRMENAVSALNCEFKLYDFRLIKEGDRLDALSFHLLVPHSYGMSEREVLCSLEDAMQIHQPGLRLQIRFVHSFL